MLRRTSMLQAPGDRCAKPTGYQAHAEFQVQGVCEREFYYWFSLFFPSRSL
jgi:hypothetical protein